MGDFIREWDSNNQKNIWEYFQNRHTDVFEGGKDRMDYIVKEMSRKKTTSKPRVLNIGAGNGYLESRLNRLKWRVYSLDPDRETIKRLSKKGIMAFQGTMEKMPFDDRSFDFVIASEVIEHLNKTQFQDGLAETERVLKDRGWFIGTVPYCEDLSLNEVVCPRCQHVFHRWGHQRSFDLNLLRQELLRFFYDVRVKRKVFVSFRSRNLPGKIKGLVRIILGHYGVKVAVPNIYFTARKKRNS